MFLQRCPEQGRSDGLRGLIAIRSVLVMYLILFPVRAQLGLGTKLVKQSVKATLSALTATRVLSRIDRQRRRPGGRTLLSAWGTAFFFGAATSCGQWRRGTRASGTARQSRQDDQHQ